MNLNHGAELEQRSEDGRISATVSLLGPELVRGSNDFSVALEAPTTDSAPALIRCDAVMPAHGHEASASRIEGEAGRFTAAGLDLFMSGRWQVTLGVELDARSEVISFALDVP